MLIYEDHKSAQSSSVVNALAFAPDGSTLASGASDGAVFLRDADGERYTLMEREANSLPIHAIAFAADDTIVVGGAFGWHGYRRDIAGKWAAFAPPMITPTNALAMLDDHTLAVGTGHSAKATAGVFELWDLNTGLRREPHFREPNGVRAVAVCPERRMVAWANAYRKVSVWEVQKRDAIEFMQPKTCRAVALSPDGKQLVVAVDWEAKVYDIERQQVRFELKGHKGAVSAVSYSPDGSTIATASWDEKVKLWDAATGRERATFKWPIGRVCSLTFAPDGLRLAAGGDIGTVVVWDME